MIVEAFFRYEWWFALISSSFILVPQIIRNVRKGHGGDNGFLYTYVIGYLAIRNPVYFYEYGCPENIYSIKPNIALTVTLISLMIIEVNGVL